jgi:diguanylate cyclase (GGDEF)-like protein
VGVLYVDLDGFKAVNDRHGHATGDAVLVATAERIQRVLRPGDVVGRLGGDEFVVICPDVPGPEDARAIGERVRSALSAEPSPAPGDVDGIQASVGVAVAPPGALDADGLLERADRALYAAKSAGRGTVRLG